MMNPVTVGVLFGIALLVFGPKKLPELGKSLGQGIGNFKKALTDAQDEVKAAVKIEPKAIESKEAHDAQEAEKNAQTVASEPVTADSPQKDSSSQT
jgi:sec-independent protein translocase protein TatA